MRRALVYLAVVVVAIAHADEGPKTSYDTQVVLESVSVASPYKLSTDARAGAIRYRFALADGAKWHWPETGEQHVAADDDGVATVTICTDCGREPAPSAEALKAYLRPNAWVDSDDVRVRDFARGAGGGRFDARMDHLVLGVQRRMNGPADYAGYKSARQALIDRSGDCTEFAVLLAAAARASSIPARVVAGMAYPSHFLHRQHAFAPHVWMQAWNGARWVSFDAALGRFDAGHVALAVGDGAPADFAGVVTIMAKMRIVDAAGVAGEAN